MALRLVHMTMTRQERKRLKELKAKPFNQMTCSELSEFDDLSRKAIDAGNTAVIIASIFSLAVQAVSIIGIVIFTLLSR